MLTMIDKREVPVQGGRQKSPVRTFAKDTMAEFLETAKPGDVAEVTGAPGFDGSVASADRVAAALRAEAFCLRKSDRVRMFRRGSRVFMERLDTHWR